MNRNSRRNLLWIALTAALASAPVHAARLVYSGVLEVDGQPANGRHDLKLTAYPSADGAVPKAAPIEFYAVEVKDGRFEVALDLPGEAREAWVDLAVRPTGAGAYIPLLGRSKAVLAPEAIGQCWSTTGDSGSNPAVNFIGTTDAQPFVVRTRNAQSLRIEPSEELFNGLPITTNTIAGSSANNVTAGVRGATIAGGGVPSGNSDPELFDENPNRVTDHYGTVGGGYANQAGDAAGTPGDRPLATVGGGRNNTASGGGSTVGGGYSNTASGTASTVGGGSFNTASGPWGTVGGGYQNTSSGADSTVGGGSDNTASGDASTVSGGNSNTASGNSSTVGGGFNNCAGGSTSWAGGSRAKVRPASDPGGTGPCSGLSSYPNNGSGDQGTFVWADSQNDNFVSTGPNQFLVRAAGGMAINTNTPAPNTALTVNGSVQAQAFNVVSDRAAKTAFAPVDVGRILAAVLQLPITSWSYRNEPTVRHLGPVAQDFYQAFGLGDSDRTISTVDANGVALAAIQGLNSKLEAERDALQAKLEAENAALVAKLEAENAELRAAQERLAAELAELRAKLLGTTEER